MGFTIRTATGMNVTLGEAARQSGISKSTISRAIRDGKLSAVRSPETGSYKMSRASWPDTSTLRLLRGQRLKRSR